MGVKFIDYYKKELIFYNNACMREFQDDVDSLVFKLEVYSGLLKHVGGMKVHAGFLQDRWSSIEKQYEELLKKMRLRLIVKGIAAQGFMQSL